MPSSILVERRAEHETKAHSSSWNLGRDSSDIQDMVAWVRGDSACQYCVSRESCLPRRNSFKQASCVVSIHANGILQSPRRLRQDWDSVHRLYLCCPSLYLLVSLHRVLTLLTSLHLCRHGVRYDALHFHRHRLGLKSPVHYWSSIS